MKKIFTILCLSFCFYAVKAQVLLETGFDGGIPSNFTIIDVDKGISKIPVINDAWVGNIVFTGQPEVFAASTSSYMIPGTADDWMITPALNLTSNVHLFWSARASNPSKRDGYEVRISTTGKAISDFNTVLFSTPGENTFWTERQINLSAYANQTVYLAFRNNSTDKEVLAIDYIIVSEVLNGDSQMDEITVADKVSSNSTINVTGILSHQGMDTLHSIDVSWRVNGKSVNTMTINGLNLKYGQTHAFTHTIPYVTGNVGIDHLEVWVSKPNGMGSANTLNDTLRKDIIVGSGTGVQRNVLFEEFTTAVCQFCPDGHVVMANILAQNPNVIPVSVHSCFGSDAMTNQDASTLCATLGNNSAPTGMVDRIQHEGDDKPAHSRSLWQSRVNSRSLVASEVSLNLSGTYNSSTRAVSLDVDASFVDHVLNGDIRLSLMVIEDSVSGSGTGWNQVNAYNGVAGHPMQGRGNPIVGYQHRHVLRDILPSTWGDATVIPSSPSIDSTYSKNFSFTLSNNYNADRVSFVAVLSYKGVTSDGYEVINAKEVKLSNEIMSAGLDAALMSINTPSAVTDGDSIDIKASVRNVNADTLKSFDLNWSIDNGTTQTANFNNLNMAFGDELEFIHTDKAELTGLNSSKTLKVWISNINGGNDGYLLNNSKEKRVKVTTPVDVVLNKLTFEEVIGDGEELIITGEISNQGVDVLNSVNINWTVNGGTVYTETINNLSLVHGQSMQFNHSNTWTASGLGSTNHFKVWVDSSNGSSEVNNVNDTLYGDVTVTTPVDLELVYLNVSDTLIKGEAVEIKGRVKNIGAEHVSSFMISWSVDGGTINKHTFSNVSIPFNTAYNFIHKDRYIPPTTLEAGKLDVYIEEVNNTSSQITSNDSITISFVAVVGINEIPTLLDKVNIYPNPTRNLTNLDLTLIENLELEVSIFDISGKVVYQKDYGRMTNGDHNLPIDVSALPNGFYIMKIQAGEQVLSKKISVNR